MCIRSCYKLNVTALHKEIAVHIKGKGAMHMTPLPNTIHSLAQIIPPYS